MYAQASAYSEAYTGETACLWSLLTVAMVIASGVKVSIHGDEEEACSFTSSWSNGGGHHSEDDSDSDMDSKTEESSSRRVSASIFILTV